MLEAKNAAKTFIVLILAFQWKAFLAFITLPPRLPDRAASARCCFSTAARTMKGQHQSYEMNISLLHTSVQLKCLIDASD